MDPKDYDKAALEAAEQAELVDGLKGLYVHIMNEAQTSWQYQGRIVGIEGGFAIVQMFAATWGHKNGLWLFPLAELARKPGGVILYRTWEEWREAGDEMSRAAAERRRADLEATRNAAKAPF